MKIRLSGLAQRDLRDVLVDLASDNLAAAVALDARFTERLKQLLQFPEMGRPRPDVFPQARGLLVAPYVIFYRVTPSTILVIRVLHTSRDLRRTGLQ